MDKETQIKAMWNLLSIQQKGLIRKYIILNPLDVTWHSPNIDQIIEWGTKYSAHDKIIEAIQEELSA